MSKRVMFNFHFKSVTSNPRVKQRVIFDGSKKNLPFFFSFAQSLVNFTKLLIVIGAFDHYEISPTDYLMKSILDGN